MAGYGYEAYGYEAATGGYGYVQYFPGGGLDAAQGLQGPGTSAYCREERYSSSASEGDRGGIFDQDTTVSSRDVGTSTSYGYGNSYYRYAHYEIARTYDTPDSYGRAYGGDAPATDFYRSIDSVTTYGDNASHTYRVTTSYYAYSDGTYTQQFGTLSLDDVDGTSVPGSSTGSESTVSGYIGGEAPTSG